MLVSCSPRFICLDSGLYCFRIDTRRPHTHSIHNGTVENNAVTGHYTNLLKNTSRNVNLSKIMNSVIELRNRKETLFRSEMLLF